ncbi:MAG: hypothetical protein JWR26_1692 [Pedosphaera sp.]|nr:hypothetical protein [Pedosphaera sp.]
MNFYNQTRLVLFITAISFSCTAALCGQTASVDGRTNRPFEVIVSTFSGKPLEQQYKYVLQLSKGLMPEAYVRRAGPSGFPHFGDLARELMAQNHFELMRELLKRREIDWEDYYTVGGLLADKLDPATFKILLTNSSPETPDATNDTGQISGTNIISQEGYPEFSSGLLCPYLKSDSYGDSAEKHLIRILREHKRTGARAAAAQALGYAKSEEAVKALEEATKDKGYTPTSNGQFDYVNEWAEESLKNIRKRQK